MRICCVCGARPNFMKVAAVLEAMRARPELEPVLVHTGQHYDEAMSERLFAELGLPRPDHRLEVGSASVVAQTAEVMRRFEPVLDEIRPDLVLVVGDVNSTLAAALVAKQKHVAAAHVEAGLRSGDRRMPEEVNRVLTDALCDLLFVSERSGIDNLRREGVDERHVFFVGNVMIDTLQRHRRRAAGSALAGELAATSEPYGLLTVHRPVNVDEPEALERLLDLVEECAERLPLVWPVHPRTRSRLEEFGFSPRLERMDRVRTTEPLGYLDFVGLLAAARVVLTDSGGIQEEATFLRVPCLTLRETTERPATVAAGANRLVGSDPARVREALAEVLAPGARPPDPPELWDGRAGERIVEVLARCAAEGVPERR